MKKRLPAFAAGMLTMALIGALTVSALAATGGVSFNASNLVFNGAQISAKGEDYALANGCMAPSSITYTDEKGGGTTYLPVRRISELLGVETGWDGATGSVTVKGDAKTPDTPDNTASANYDDWTPEEEAAYQEFKGMWNIEYAGTGVDEYGLPLIGYEAVYKEALGNDDAKAAIDAFALGKDIELLQKRLVAEYKDGDTKTIMYFVNEPQDGSVGRAILSPCIL